AVQLVAALDVGEGWHHPEQAGAALRARATGEMGGAARRPLQDAPRVGGPEHGHRGPSGRDGGAATRAQPGGAFPFRPSGGVCQRVGSPHPTARGSAGSRTGQKSWRESLGRGSLVRAEIVDEAPSHARLDFGGVEPVDPSLITFGAPVNADYLANVLPGFAD